MYVIRHLVLTTAAVMPRAAEYASGIVAYWATTFVSTA
jgi:hypothetical protein